LEPLLSKVKKNKKLKQNYFKKHGTV
jgi:hypothetical protein